MRFPRVLLPLVLMALALSSTAQGQAPRLKVQSTADAKQLEIQGDTGVDHRLESIDTLGGPWQFRLTLPLTNSTQQWLDSESAPARFYRAVRLGTPEPHLFSPNFRLIDHLGRSHELYYWTNQIAFVVIHVANGCSNVENIVGSIKTLRNQFEPQGIKFWMMNSTPGESRSNIVAEANRLGIDLPILIDRGQLLAREHEVSATPEAIAISGSDSKVFYRGAIDDRIGSNALASTQFYLSNALQRFLVNAPVSPSHTRPLGCAVSTASVSNVSYATDIVPLLQRRCIDCHREGAIAPWAMTNYGIIQQYALSMKDQVLSGRMPPWHADYEYQKFTNDVSLTPAEATILVQWINQGAPRGTGPDPLETNPPQPQPVWELGPPDQIVRIAPQSLPATGPIGYRYINVTTTFPSNVWLRAAVVRPGNRRVVHHCLVFEGTNSLLRGLDGFFTGYVPGTEPDPFPPGTGKLLPAGRVLQFQMHYIATGQPETDQTELGLYVMPAPPTYPLQTKSAFNVSFTIPANAQDYAAEASYTFARKSRIYEMSPHMHFRGSRARYEVVTNGVTNILLNVPKYSFDWQRNYRLVQPFDVPAGAVLRVKGAFDNSVFNASNPDPNATVRFGEQTYEEMFIGYFNFAEIP